MSNAVLDIVSSTQRNILLIKSSVWGILMYTKFEENEERFPLYTIGALTSVFLALLLSNHLSKYSLPRDNNRSFIPSFFVRTETEGENSGTLNLKKATTAFHLTQLQGIITTLIAWLFCFWMNGKIDKSFFIIDVTVSFLVLVAIVLCAWLAAPSSPSSPNFLLNIRISHSQRNSGSEADTENTETPAVPINQLAI